MTGLIPSSNQVSIEIRNLTISAQGASADKLAMAISLVVLFIGIAIMINILNK